jgi:hypothetical protein
VDWDYIENGAEIVRVYQGGAGSVAAQPERAVLTDLLPLRKDRNNPHTIGQTANEIFFQEDRVIVVEGQEDVVLYPKVEENLDTYLMGSFFGWGAGGVGNVAYVLALLQELGLKSVVALLDGNVSKKCQELDKQFQSYHICAIPADDVRTKQDSKKEEELTKGLLDTNLNVRDEYREETIKLFQGINRYLAEGQSDTNGAGREPEAQGLEES